MSRRTTAPSERAARIEPLTRLATGGMADIWLARELGAAGLERFVVVKRLLPHLAREPEIVDMFVSEARFVARLVHPNVVQIHDLGEDDEGYFLVMEYVAGCSANELLTAAAQAKKPLPLGAALCVAEQACMGAHAAHELRAPTGEPLGLVHRDISPHNLMVGPSGEVKLLDFGIAKATAAAEATRTGSLKGKHGYMSPEQCAVRHVDRRSDVFALGIVAWELFTGARLFKRETEYATMHAIVNGDKRAAISVRSDLPSGLDAVLDKALATDPDQRFQTADAFRRALVSALEEARVRGSRDDLVATMHDLLGDRLEERERALREAAKAGAVPEPHALRAALVTSESSTPGPRAGSPEGVATVVQRRAPHLYDEPEEAEDAPAEATNPGSTDRETTQLDARPRRRSSEGRTVHHKVDTGTGLPPLRSREPPRSKEMHAALGLQPTRPAPDLRDEPTADETRAALGLSETRAAPEPNDARAVQRLNEPRPARTPDETGAARTSDRPRPARAPDETGAARTPDETGATRTPDETGTARTGDEPRAAPTGSERPSPQESVEKRAAASSEEMSSAPPTTETRPAEPTITDAPARPPLVSSTESLPTPAPRSGASRRSWLLGAIAIAAVALVVIFAARRGRETGLSGSGVTSAPTPGGPALRFVVAPTVEAPVLKSELAPFLKWLGTSLNRPVELILAESYDHTGQLVSQGKADVALMPPLLLVRAMASEPKLQPLVVRLFDGSRASDGYLLVRDDGPTGQAGDLRGRTICYVDKASTTGYLLPRVWMRKAGVDPERDMKSVLSGDHVAAMRDLVAGKCDAAAVYSGAFFSARQQGIAVGQLRVFAITGRVPQDALVASPSMPAADVNALHAALLHFEPRRDIDAGRIGEVLGITGFAEYRTTEFEAIREAAEKEGLIPKSAAPP